MGWMRVGAAFATVQAKDVVTVDNIIWRLVPSYTMAVSRQQQLLSRP